MAKPTSNSTSDATIARIKSASSTLSADTQSILAEIRKAFIIVKEIAVDFEKTNKPSKVKKLETTAAELLETYADCMNYASVIESVGNEYQPGAELTNFKSLLEEKLATVKANSVVSENHPLMRRFKEAVWNVHHGRKPMPGEEQEEIIVTNTQSSLLNLTCPLSGKPITELAEPVRSLECKHIYDKNAVILYLAAKNPETKCPIAGCPKILKLDNVACDSLLPIEIEELRMVRKRAARTVVQDFTEQDEFDAS